MMYGVSTHEVYLAEGVEPLKDEVMVRMGVFVRGKLKRGPPHPVGLADPLDVVLVQTFERIRNLAGLSGEGVQQRVRSEQGEMVEGS